MSNLTQIRMAEDLGDYEVSPLVPTGIRALDKAFRGGIPQNKIALFAARTSHGKTATAVRLAHNFSHQGRAVRMLWCEDEASELTCRLRAVAVGAELPEVMAAYRDKALLKRFPLPEKAKEAWDRIEVYQMQRPTVAEICDIIRRCPKGAVLIIDHLGEVAWNQGPKHEAIGDGFREIRKAGLAARVLVVCMAQLNRDWDRRKAAAQKPDDVRPVLSDIENSGQLEQSARYCAIMERLPGENGEFSYVFHVFKPDIRDAVCRWDERTCTPDNATPAKVAEQVRQPDLLASSPTATKTQEEDASCERPGSAGFQAAGGSWAHKTIQASARSAS